MAQIETVLITSIIGLVLFVCGVFFRKRALLIALAGSIIILITGLLLIVDEPILYKSGQTIEINTTSIDNASITTELFTYAPQNTFLNDILSWSILLLGFSGTLGVANNVWNMRYDEDE